MMMSVEANETGSLVGVSDGIDEIDDLVDLLRRAILQFQPGPESIAHDWPNLTMQQLRIMRILYTEGATRVSVLARHLAVSTPTVTGILDRLVRQGLTSRADDPRDRRVVLNMLTESGLAVMEHFQPILESRLVGSVERLDPSERQALRSGLRGLLAEDV